MKITKLRIFDAVFILLISVQLFLASFASCAQSIVPPDGKTLLVIGQDLSSIYNYNNSSYFPTPGGVTSYLNLYDVTNPSAAYPYGALGENVNGELASDVDWGAGPLNTHNAGYGYANSTLAIGVYMTEDYYPNGLQGIANGTYDEEILRLGNFLKTLNQPVFLRIGYEFDGQWNTGYENKTNYKNAYKHIVDIIRPMAPKTMMVWQASTSPVDDILEGYHEDITEWYPGDDYVDYMGYSWFLSTQQQYDLTDEVVDFAREKGKPVMVCEASPQGYDLNELNYRYINTMLGGAPGTNPQNKTPDEIWNEWFKPFFDYIHANSDVIRVVSYINADWDSQGKWGAPYNEGYWGDSRVEANAAIRQKWANEITSDFWIQGSETLFDELEGNTEGEPIDKAPVVSFLSPNSGLDLETGDDIVVEINATDDNEVTNVILFMNNQYIGELSSTPYKWSSETQLKNLAKGSYILKVEATDNANKTTQKTLTFTVSDPSTTNPPVIGDNFAPEDGKTLLMIGQTYKQEYIDYVNAVKAPAGSSHYAELYTGKINQGDDGNNEAFLDYIETTYPNAYAELAISIKDNPAAGGYSGPNGVWQACKDISAGVWDSEIDNIAQSIKARPSIKFIVRIGYEVSLNMFANKTTTDFIDILNKYTAMGINPLEKAAEIEEFDLQAYKDAFNYIAHRIRVTNQVENAAFVFHPVRGINDAKQLYPGDEYVDWYGISLFNHDVCWPTWEGANPPFENCPESQAFDDNVRQSLDWAKEVIKKPIIIAESAAQSHVTQQAGADHIDGYLNKVFNVINTYNVKAFVYINSNWSSHGWSDQWGDSRVQKSNESLQYWKNEVYKDRYIHYQKEVVTDLSTLNSTSGISVFPNPSTDVFTIDADGNSRVEFINSEGKIVLTENFTDMTDVGRNLPAGIYIVRVISPSGTQTFKIRKQ